MAILQDELPSTAVTIVSQQSPDLAAGLLRGRIDLAFLRQEKDTPGLTYRLLRREPLVVLMRADHRLTDRAAIRPEDLVDEMLVGVPVPTLRLFAAAWLFACIAALELEGVRLEDL